MCRVKPYGEDILKIKGLGWAIAQSSPAFWKYLPPMDFLHIIKHETKFIMDHTYEDHKA